ncbi:MAG: hypothetical protein JWR12_3014 [Mucilaginibacter sp.]|nr:hypothetical protein [Mucilaginibacter sp.]
MKLLQTIAIIMIFVAKQFRRHFLQTLRPVFLTGFILILASLDGCKKDSSSPKSSQTNGPPAIVLLAPGVVKVDSTVTLNAALLKYRFRNGNI